VVRVADTINPTLAGHGDDSYQSPSLSHEEAQTLVRLLFARGQELPTDERRWTCPIAGGRRSVTLTEAAGDTHHLLMQPCVRCQAVRRRCPLSSACDGGDSSSAPFRGRSSVAGASALGGWQ
jgi:hypothetical protein